MINVIQCISDQMSMLYKCNVYQTILKFVISLAFCILSALWYMKENVFAIMYL